MMCGPDQSNELSMLDGDDGSMSPDSGRIGCTIKTFQLFGAGITVKSNYNHFHTVYVNIFVVDLILLLS